MTLAITVRHPRDLTAAWAQRIVAQHATGAVVARVEVLAMEVGTTTRVRIAVDHNGPETLPRRWFIKLPSLSWRARSITALPQLLQTEVRFYQEMTQSVPLSQPVMLAAQSRLGWGATLVLADVTENGAVPGAPGDALSAGQATAVVEQLARLHAQFWCKASLDHELRWLAGPVRQLEDRLGEALAVPLMLWGLHRAGSSVPKSLHTGAVAYARRRRQVMRFLENGPLTLVHHDTHPGNFFWQNVQPGLLDWQLVRIGEGIGDIAYFLATALSPETRRTHEAQLVTRYQQCLIDQGIAGLDSSTLWQRYRAHLMYPFEAMVATLAVGGLMALKSNLELIRRAAVAVADHDAFSTIPVRGA
jgi:hypothetical protein